MGEGCYEEAIGFFGIFFSSTIFVVNAKTINLSCPNLDERAKDLEVVLDKSNGTASFQSPTGGSGLNFTEKASFGSELVTWTRRTELFKQSYSVNRVTLELQRKTYSMASGETYNKKSECTMLKESKSAKF